MMSEEDKLEELSNVYQVSRDVERALRQEFHDRWGKERVDIPIVLVDWPSIWEAVLAESPKVLNDWSQPLLVTEELVGVLGALAEPFAHFVNLSRRYVIAHNINLYVSLGYIDMVFDPDKLAESYRVTDLAKVELKDKTYELLELLVKAHEAF